ncbi:TetR/AcrR family transcriptional regulator [Sphingobium aromaticiconvertens]|uniref:TetR/AcrR family transcriptional regulator n=1 Tax=Sphingobium aromaticiconvertens TaxID=365341 RepID=UPI00301709D7
MSIASPPDSISGPNAGRPRGRPPITAGDIARRRDRIIDVAAHMFFAKGFADTTLDAVGREAGFTKRTIYELVGDKNALFRAAYDRLHIRNSHLEFSIPAPDQSVREVLTHLARQLIEHSLSKALIASERAIMLEAGHYPELVGEVVQHGRIALDGAIAEIFDTLAARGSIEPLDSRLAAGVFYDVAVGARGFRAALGHPDEVIPDAELAARIAMFEKGYLRCNSV